MTDPSPSADRPENTSEAGNTSAAENTSGPEEALEPICSAKGCQQPAAFDLAWNNPKIHTPERRKHWVACPEHRDSLAGFLSARGFLRDVTELPVTPAT